MRSYYDALDYEPTKPPREPWWKSSAIIVVGAVCFLGWVLYMAVSN